MKSFYKFREDLFSVPRRTLAKTINNNGYEAASDMLHQLLLKKTKEAAPKALKHNTAYYAQQIAQSTKNIDRRDLLTFYTKHYGREAIL
jgi:hypothetical protein